MCISRFRDEFVAEKDRKDPKRQLISVYLALRITGSYVCTLFVLDARCAESHIRFTEIAKRQAADLPHGSLTPAVVLTEPPNAVTRSRREYHYRSGCRGHAGCSPTLIAGFLARRIAGHGVPDYSGSCFHTSPELKS